jgi:hypothetical protein
MSLFVTYSDYRRRPSQGAEVDAPQDDRSQIELAATRVAKFIPSIIILGYAGLCNLVNSKNRDHDASFRLVGFQVAFWICLVLTPGFILFFDRKNAKSMRWRNACVGTVAFPIWAYAFPCGWFVDINKYDPVVAGFALLVFSILTAFVPAPNFE